MSVHTTQNPPVLSPFSGILFLADMVGGVENAGVHSWRHSCLTAPDAPQTRCKALTKQWKGTAVDNQADPAYLDGAPSPTQTVLSVSCPTGNVYLKVTLLRGIDLWMYGDARHRVITHCCRIKCC